MQILHRHPELETNAFIESGHCVVDQWDRDALLKKSQNIQDLAKSMDSNCFTVVDMKKLLGLGKELLDEV